MSHIGSNIHRGRSRLYLMKKAVKRELTRTILSNDDRRDPLADGWYCAFILQIIPVMMAMAVNKTRTKAVAFSIDHFFIRKRIELAKIKILSFLILTSAR